MRDFFGKIGATSAFMFSGVARLGSLFASVTGVIVSSLYKRKVVKSRHIFNQIVLMGVDSLGIICLMGAAVGAVLALQGGYQLKDIGAVSYTGSLVSVSIMRELGPLMAAIVITGRIGARVAAELGTMKVQEEVDALTTMGLNPIRYLVAPRCIALMIVLPLLTIIADIVGMIGGFLVGVFSLNINPYLYVTTSMDILVLKDVYTGLAKSVFFALIIGLISCHQGLSVDGGADGVGKSTTQAVVTSIILIIVMDAVLTSIFFYAFP